MQILKYLYEKRNDGKYHTLFEVLDKEYNKIIGPIEDLSANALVTRAVEQSLNMFEDPDPNFDYRIPNTRCKITQAGILYFEKVKETRFNKSLSVTALIISIGTLIFTIWDKYFSNT